MYDNLYRSNCEPLVEQLKAAGFKPTPKDSVLSLDDGKADVRVGFWTDSPITLTVYDEFCNEVCEITLENDVPDLFVVEVALALWNAQRRK